MRTFRSMETWMASWVLRTLADVSTLITLSVRVMVLKCLADGRCVRGIAVVGPNFQPGLHPDGHIGAGPALAYEMQPQTSAVSHHVLQ